MAKAAAKKVKDLGIPTTLSSGQGRHVPPVNDKRSVLTADPAELLRGLHAGDFRIMRESGQNKALVDFRSRIGEHWRDGAKVGETQYGWVHYGKKGAHIVPANPEQW